MQDHLHASDQGTVDFLKKVGQKQLATRAHERPGARVIAGPRGTVVAQCLVLISLGTNSPAFPIPAPAK
jgi:hypothetical protein